MNNLNAEIEAAAEAILKTRPRYSRHVVGRVVDVLIKRLTQKNTEHLSQTDLKTIKDELVIGDQRSYQTWLHLDCFNQIVFRLRIGDKIECPYFNIPQRISRHLLFEIEDDVFINTRYIQILRDDLLSYRVDIGLDQKNEEIECICTFIASACIFAKILFPNFHRSLQSLRFQDIHFSPASISMPLNESETFYRYFLPYPTAIYFLRCMLFYKKNYRDDWVMSSKDPAAQVFKPVNYHIEDLSALFKEWTASRLRAKGVHTEGLNIPSFRSAVRMASVLRTEGASDSFPVFTLAVQSGELVNYSLGNKYLAPLLGEKASVSAASNLKNKRQLAPLPQNDSLTQLITDIRAIRRPLLKIRRCSLRQRIAAAENITRTVTNYSEALTSDDYENCRLYAEWVASLLRGKSYSIKTVNDYASNVKTFLFFLAGKGLINEIDHASLVSILIQAMDRCESRGVRTALKSYTYFLKTLFGDGLTLPAWQKSAGLRKQDVLHQVTLIDFDSFAAAVKESQHFYSLYATRLQKKEAVQSSVHKSKILTHVMSLAFYAGLRVGEIINLRVSNVIFDDGIVLCVRASKTKNGIRNIPLNSVVPEGYLLQFKEYFYSRRAEANEDDFLFVQNNNMKWDRSHVSSEVARLFKYIGHQGFKFHHLRHSFANWFMIRWLLTFHADKVPADLPFLKNDFFNKHQLANIRRLVHGVNQNIGQDTSSHALAVLARLLGHGGPMVTIERYIHNIDWIVYILSKANNKESIHISSRQSESFLQLSYPSLPRSLKGRGKKAVSPEELTKYQCDLLR